MEFEQNAQNWRYPSDLIERVWAACREVEQGLIRQEYPFDHDKQVELYHRIEREQFTG